MSKTILLNHSNWHFTKENTGIPDAVMGEAIALPHTWNAVDGQDGGNDYYRGTCWYTLALAKPTIPAVVSGTYSLIDKLITSVAAVIATAAVAVLGYTTTMPQPTDAYTSGIFWMTLAIKYGLPMLGWLITLLAMVGCPLTKEEMVNVQKRIADKKDALRHEVIAEHMQ